MLNNPMRIRINKKNNSKKKLKSKKRSTKKSRRKSKNWWISWSDIPNLKSLSLLRRKCKSLSHLNPVRKVRWRKRVPAKTKSSKRIRFILNKKALTKKLTENNKRSIKKSRRIWRIKTFQSQPAKMITCLSSWTWMEMDSSVNL